MRLVLISALSLLVAPAAADAQNIVMRRQIPTAKGGGTSAGDQTGGGQTDGTVIGGVVDAGPAYASYSFCAGADQYDFCYGFENGSYQQVAMTSCATKQSAAKQLVVTSMSLLLLGDPKALLPAGTPVPDLKCTAPPPPPVTTGTGWRCSDETGTTQVECYVVDKQRNAIVTWTQPESCNKPNPDGFADTLAYLGLNAPAYDGSCVNPVHGWKRSCGYVGDAGTYQPYTSTGTCFALNEKTGVVSPAATYNCYPDKGYSTETLGHLAAAGLYPGGRPDSQYGPDGQECKGADAMYLRRLLKSDVTTPVSAPDARGQCTATRTLAWQIICKDEVNGTFATDISQCSGQMAEWTKQIAASVPAGGSVSSDSYDSTPTANAFQRRYSITYPAICGS